MSEVIGENIYSKSTVVSIAIAMVSLWFFNIGLNILQPSVHNMRERVLGKECSFLPRNGFNLGYLQR